MVTLTVLAKTLEDSVTRAAISFSVVPIIVWALATVTVPVVELPKSISPSSQEIVPYSVMVIDALGAKTL